VLVLLAHAPAPQELAQAARAPLTRVLSWEPGQGFLRAHPAGLKRAIAAQRAHERRVPIGQERVGLLAAQ
jgi:hypothetical protein